MEIKKKKKGKREITRGGFISRRGGEKKAVVSSDF